MPLKHFAIRHSFKNYSLDVGLLGAMSGIPVDLVASGEKLFNEYQGAFIENYVLVQLAASMGNDLYYWRSQEGRAEIDFLLEHKARVYPLEVKAGINLKSKSLGVYQQQFNSDQLIRSNLLNFKQDGAMYNIPLFAIELLPGLLSP